MCGGPRRTCCANGGCRCSTIPTRLQSWGYRCLRPFSRMCRMLYTLRHGTIVSKRFAARWAQDTLDPRWTNLVRGRAGVVTDDTAGFEGDAGAHPVERGATRYEPAAAPPRVIVEGLLRAGIPRAFAGPGASSSVVGAVRARGHVVIRGGGRDRRLRDGRRHRGAHRRCPVVALVSLGGGLAPVVDGAAHATRDRAAVIVISDAPPTRGSSSPVVKASVVADAASSGHWIAHAAQAAMGRPARSRSRRHHRSGGAGAPDRHGSPSHCPCPRPPASALDALADSIARAGKPVIVAGLETGPDDAKWLRALAESVPAPVLTTPKGKGARPDPHPLALGLLVAGHPLLALSDLLVRRRRRSGGGEPRRLARRRAHRAPRPRAARRRRRRRDRARHRGAGAAAARPHARRTGTWPRSIVSSAGSVPRLPAGPRARTPPCGLSSRAR